MEKKITADTVIDRMPQCKENRPLILKPPCAKHLGLGFVLFCFLLLFHVEPLLARFHKTSNDPVEYPFKT